ncbi:inovirus-type Gp2 protein [Aliarcobacter skirrowii]|uniref:YagK/YfjJ domain-containing protein n=1 Tax=Aliarcobacter skirrowii TaxID=28200 RepID=UPI00082EA548|nr:inovirus-type Gp2 protein [Aliarcobacter skirrowii]MDX4060712.1 inovirus-type Gp2 protein [Aliarcobacter skirrowii]
MERKESKKYNQRLDSTKVYMDGLQERYSKINCVRVDLGYAKEFSGTVTIEDVNKDFQKMLNNKRSKPTVFEGMVGYVAKKELGDDKGVHIHMLAIYDGQKVREDVTKGKQIGEYWKDNITKGKGVYHNCNQNDYKENKGIGMIEHNDKNKRKILDEKVLTYLCKDEQSVDGLKVNSKDRAFTRGIASKSKSNAGRPRTIKNK